MLDIQKVREKNLTFDKLKGKTIEGVSCRFETMIMSFTDGTYTVLEAEGGYEGDGPEIGHDESPNLALLMMAGVISREEFDEHEKYNQEQRNLAAEKREREIFEQLKAKYGER